MSGLPGHEVKVILTADVRATKLHQYRLSVSYSYRRRFSRFPDLWQYLWQWT